MAKETPTAGKKMSAVAAILNPITENKPEKSERRVLLHYAATNNQTLTLEQRFINNAPGTVRGWVNSDDPKAPKPPSLANPSTLVALNVDDYVHVYGVLNDEKGTIAMVSPVFQRLPATSATGMIAGSATKTAGYVYYESSNNGVPFIAMKEVSGLAEGDPDSGCQEVSPGTWIDAVADTGGINWVAYQKKSTIVTVLNQSKKMAFEVDTSTTEFSANTPIGITFVSKKNFPETHTWRSPSPRGQLFVYWLDANSILMRAVAEVSTNSDFPAFEKPQRVGDMAHYIESFAQMSVVPNRLDRKNLIYTIKKGSNEGAKLSVIEDPWFKKQQEED